MILDELYLMCLQNQDQCDLEFSKEFSTVETTRRNGVRKKAQQVVLLRESVNGRE
jgi:hypothetical protein